MTAVLIVEDDARIASFLERGLKAEGFGVSLARDGEAGLKAAQSAHFDIVVLDLMLPRMDGLEVCRRLREQGSDAFVVMLTAKDQLNDKLLGLTSGADDYLTKPFAFDELVARLRAFQRRSVVKDGGHILETGDVRVDLDAKTVWRGDRRIALTAREFALLAFLMRNSGSVVSRARLLSNVWNLNFDPGTKVVDVYIRYLRQKLDEDGAAPLIRTVRGFGYAIGGGEEGSRHGVDRL